MFLFVQELVPAPDSSRCHYVGLIDQGTAQPTAYIRDAYLSSLLFSSQIPG